MQGSSGWVYAYNKIYQKQGVAVTRISGGMNISIDGAEQKKMGCDIGGRLMGFMEGEE